MRFAAPLALLALATTSCTTVGPNYQAPASDELSVPSGYYGPEPAGSEQQAPADLSRWWELFEDPPLTRLIDEANADNLDLAVAASRLSQAREALVQTRAGQVPTVGASGGVNRNVFDGEDVTRVDLGVDAA